jgi:uncharacterized protein YeaC (DUF1315 family)
MDLKQLLDSITPEVYESLKRAIEIGKWPDGRVLGEGQKELCMQAVIAYDERKPLEQRTVHQRCQNQHQLNGKTNVSRSLRSSVKNGSQLRY